MNGYSFELITGPMSCGKTEELLRRIRRCVIAKKKVKVFSPKIDTRSKIQKRALDRCNQDRTLHSNYVECKTGR